MVVIVSKQLVEGNNYKHKGNNYKREGSRFKMKLYFTEILLKN